MDYAIRRSTRAKNIRIQVKPDGAVILVLPKFVPKFLGKNFVQKNIAWIEKKRAKILSQKNIYDVDLVGGARLFWFGIPRIILRIMPNLASRNYYEFSDGVLKVFVAKNSRVSKCDNIQGLVQDFYTDQAREYLGFRSEYFAEKLEVEFSQIRIKDAKTRWGSCSSQGNLNYNWRIMLCRLEIIDYLVVHEVCHLREMNHSAKFWELVESLDPEFRLHRTWLKDEGRGIMGFLQ